MNPNEQENTTPRIQEGFYDATCTGVVDFGLSESDGEQVAIQLDIDGNLVTSYLAFAGEALQHSVAKLTACGWTGQRDAAAVGAAIKGHKVRVGIQYRQFQGKTKMEVNIFDQPAGPRKPFKREMSETQVGAFLQRIARGAAPGAAPSGPSNRGYPANWDEPTPTRSGGGFSLNKPAGR
ncbi:hypothetical protein LZC95_08390 [Pendulispora brunnea]|uniref:Uncharacterized protein n=1 Tax=Pendulispora brunnea TaxID=2905690 RepID=A0ABZ2KE37_9BACT